MDFLQTLLILLIVFVSIRLIWKYFGKMILKWLGMKAMQQVQKSFEKRAGFQSGQNPFQNNTERPKSTSRQKAPLKSNENKKVGEYIDFEEID